VNKPQFVKPNNKEETKMGIHGSGTAAQADVDAQEAVSARQQEIARNEAAVAKREAAVAAIASSLLAGGKVGTEINIQKG